MKPILTINGHDYAPLVEALNISKNDLDAEGSGRDVQTGLMYRTRVARKLKAEVRLLRLQQAQLKQLGEDLSGAFYDAAIIDPETGKEVTRTFYTAERPFGAQRLNRKTGAPYYDGVSFSMIER